MSMVPAVAAALALARGAVAVQTTPRHHAPRIALQASVSRPALLEAAPQLAGAPAANVELDPEVRSIQAALRGIEQDPAAREKVYSEVDSLVRKVRNHEPIPRNLMLDEELPLPQRATGSSVTVGFAPASLVARPELTPSPASREPDLNHFPVASLLSPKGTALDPAVVARVTYWAHVNGCPVELALATAWQESRMSLHPSRGASGEIGIMQILPERARLEGVDPSRLEDRETNLWLGTKLLARYYSEEGSVARAAMKYVAGPGVFGKRYSPDVRHYIAWYSASVNGNAEYFGRYVSF